VLTANNMMALSTKARVFAGLTQFPGKLLSLFEPHTEIIRKGKASKPNEFGKLVELQEAENQIITHYEVFEVRPSNRHLHIPAEEAHRRKLGRVPGWVAADAAGSVSSSGATGWFVAAITDSRECGDG